MAIAHADGPRIFVDYVRAWRAPGRGRYIDYNSVLAEVVATMRRYGAPKAFSDQVSAAAISAELGKASLWFEQTVTYGTKAGPKFQTLRQKVISGELALPDNEVLIGQLKRSRKSWPRVEGARSRRARGKTILRSRSRLRFIMRRSTPSSSRTLFASTCLARRNRSGCRVRRRP